MKSKITGGETTLLFTAKVLQKYDVAYYRCNETGFIQTQEPHWLDEAYKSTITKLDVGLVHRNIHLAESVEKLLIHFFNYKGTFLDYAGGYGLFTRLMRDNGFNFYNTDKYCPNLFAEYFDLDSLPPDTLFEMVTAFEVFEHLTNPVDEIKNMLKFSDNLLFTTELQPAGTGNIKDWHYLSFETGQHIAFYNVESLQYLAKLLGYHLYTNNSSIHLFTKKAIAKNPFQAKEKVKDPFLLRKAKKYIEKKRPKDDFKLESLIHHDWQLIKNKLNN